MQTGEGEFGAFFLGSVLARNGVHSQSSFNDQSLADLNAILKILGKIAPANNLQRASRVIGAERIETDLHFGDRGLIVLGVSQGGSLENIHLKYAVIHSLPGR